MYILEQAETLIDFRLIASLIPEGVTNLFSYNTTCFLQKQYLGREGINFVFTDVAAEKTEKALIAGIEHFDPSKLKHTETHEKNPLPDKEGN